jgi:hypothetical protein
MKVKNPFAQNKPKKRLFEFLPNELKSPRKKPNLFSTESLLLDNTTSANSTIGISSGISSGGSGSDNGGTNGGISSGAIDTSDNGGLNDDNNENCLNNTLKTDCYNDCNDIPVDDSIKTMITVITDIKIPLKPAKYYYFQLKYSPFQASLIERILNQKAKTKKEVAELDYFKRGEDDFIKTFMNLFKDFKKGFINEFIYQNDHFMVIFNRIGQSIHSKLLNATTGLINILKQQKISFSSYQNSDSTLDFTDSVHCLFDFLLNWKDPLLSNRTRNTPLLLSHQQFLSSTFKQNEIIEKTIQSDNTPLQKTVVKGLLFSSDLSDTLNIIINQKRKGLILLDTLESSKQKGIKRIEMDSGKIKYW